MALIIRRQWVKLEKYQGLTMIISVSFRSTFWLIITFFMTNRHHIAAGIFTLDMPIIRTKRRERKGSDREGREERSHITLPYLRWKPPSLRTLASFTRRVKSEFVALMDKNTNIETAQRRDSDLKDGLRVQRCPNTWSLKERVLR